jgi:DNA-binding transcriptional LysR family regulator
LQAVSRVVEDALLEGRYVGGGQAGLLRIGVTPATTDFAVQALLPALIAERPAAHISFTTAFGSGLMDTLSRREVELAICPIPETLDPALECETLYEDPCSLMMSKSHPLAGRHSLPLEELIAFPWAATKKHEFTRARVKRALAVRGLGLPRIVVEADTLSALILIVSRTQLISMINVRSARTSSLPENVMVRPISLEGMERQVGIVRRTGYLSPIALRAQEILRDAAVF